MADTCDIPYADRTETEIEFAVLAVSIIAKYKVKHK